MAEARYHPRLRVLAHADVIGAEVVLGRPLEDLSLGGCKLGGPGWEDAGATVSVLLNFPAITANLALPAVVLRSGARGMALRFHGISEEQRHTLRKHMQDSQEAIAAG